MTFSKSARNSPTAADRQKVETITRYTTPKLQDFWESLNGYVASDWKNLKRELLKLFKSPSALMRHSEQKLRGFAQESARSRMRSVADVVYYYREFLVLSKPLLDSQWLTPSARDKIFWYGFHKRDRAEMHTSRLIAKHPHQPTNVYFDYLAVYEVATAILDGHDPDSGPIILRTNLAAQGAGAWSVPGNAGTTRTGRNTIHVGHKESAREEERLWN
jgi:hypothetical protein